LAGVGFGTQLVLLKLASASSILSLLVVIRASGLSALLLVLLFLRPSVRGTSFWVTGTVAGILDTIGNVFYLGATRLGRLDAAAVVCSLYPAGTITLASIFLHERPSLRQLTGMAVALIAVALLSM
jgi:drug/metabolite transporter (DMT)-like permease